jgi:peptidoglycan/LPS O-acetylase OafA/YrhL
MGSKSFLERFSRVTTSGKFISEIDGLRFIAIGTVVLFHIAVSLRIRNAAAFTIPAGNLLGGIASKGFHGVELFFIISGFILAMPFAAHHLKKKPAVRLGSYYLRRVTRLEPPYILSMLLLFAAIIILKGLNPGTLLPHLLASLGYVHNLVYGQESLINNVAWSLEIEIQFYILAPILAMLFTISNRSVRRFVIGVLILLGAAGHAFVFQYSRMMSLTILNFIQFFLIGFLLCDLFLESWNEAPRRNYAWDLVSLIGWPVLFYIWNSPDPSRYLFSGEYSNAVENFFFPCAAFLLYVAVFRGRISNRIMTNPWITTVGGMCYTIYLVHNYIIGTATLATKNIVATNSYTLNFLLQVILIVPIILIVSGIYFALIERPCMKKDWPQRLYARVTGSQPVQGKGGK